MELYKIFPIGQLATVRAVLSSNFEGTDFDVATKIYETLCDLSKITTEEAEEDIQDEGGVEENIGQEPFETEQKKFNMSTTLNCVD